MDNNVTYSEEIVKKLIEKSLLKMEKLDQLCEEMEDNPKVYKLFIECVEKLSNVLDKLFKMQNQDTSKDIKHKDAQVGNTNNIVLISSSELLNRIESKFYGVKTRADVYK